MGNNAGRRRRFGAVRELKSGQWQARYRGPDGMMRPADHTFSTKTAAERWLTRKEAEILNDEWINPDAGRVPFGEYAAAWIDERPNLRPKTIRLYRYLLRSYLRPAFGAVAVADRRHAAVNPAAWFYGQPITLADHQASRWIAEPLRLLDCCQESDGAVALVVTSLERARDLRSAPAVIRAAAQGAGPDQFTMTSYYSGDLTGLPAMGVVARQLWAQSGLGPAAIRTAILYDHFTPYVLMQLEELGFCPRGEARHFIAGGAIEVGGALPLNTHGGQLGEAYVHGMNGIAEAVRQVRGTSVNQVPGDGAVLVTAGTGVPTSGMVLAGD